MEALPQNRLSAKKLAGVLLLVTGLACLAFTLVNLARDLSLWVLGRHTTAEVVDLWIEEPDENETGNPTSRYFIRYEFTTSEGQVITRTTTVAPIEWTGLGQGRQELRADDTEPISGERAAGVYQEQMHVPESGIGGMQRGSPVDVVYFPPYPAHNRLDDSHYVPLLACAYLPLVVLGMVGVLGGWRLIRPGPAGSKGTAVPGTEWYNKR
jgi:hypothetical protein